MRAVAGNSWGASKKALLTIYRSLIRSVIDYGAVAYNSASKSIKHWLDVIQNKALRMQKKLLLHCSLTVPVRSIIVSFHDEHTEPRVISS